MKSIVLLAVVGMAIAMRDQSIAVRGKLICGSKPASNVRVKLWEEDSGTGFHVHSFGPISKDYYLNYIITVEAANSKGPDPDDLLDQGYTDANGEFHLQGGTAELTPIDPVFKVYHDCDDGIKPGSRKVKFALPKSYITHGKTPKKTFDIGILNLETIFAKEEREMIVSRRRRGGINADYMDPDKSKSSEEETFF